ncbi:unnamed protein product [Victoria cruziana]
MVLHASSNPRASSSASLRSRKMRMTASSKKKLGLCFLMILSLSVAKGRDSPVGGLSSRYEEEVAAVGKPEQGRTWRRAARYVGNFRGSKRSVPSCPDPLHN